MYKLKIPVDIYETAVQLTIPKDLESWQAYHAKKHGRIKSEKASLDIGDIEGCVFESGNDYVVVLIQSFLSHNVIAHELYHLAQKICEDRGVEDQEAMAWLIGYLTDRVYKYLHKKNIIIPIK